MHIAEPDYHNQEDYKVRSQKLNEISELQVEPYPHNFSITHTPKQLSDLFGQKTIGHSDDAASGSTLLVRAAGRVMLFRPMGKNIFAQLQDETGKIQIMCNRDLTKVEGYDPANSKDNLSFIKFIEKKIDLGDIIGVEGNLFHTQRGELTIFVKKLTLLSKSLLSLPDKHAGLTDKGVLYRKRWLDLISHPESIKTFIIRSKIIKIIRSYMEDANFTEVETNVLQNIYGGADAQPFKTHLNSLHQDMFLRISLEIPLKKLIVGGFLRVFEIGKVFRNEGIDHTHNPEFTEIEGYAAYWDYNDMMSFMEKMFETIALKLFSDTKAIIQGKEIDFKTPWIRISMKDSLKKYAQIDIDAMSLEQMKKKLMQEKGYTPDTLKNLNKGHLIAELFASYVEEHLIQPHHITDHPIETTPLCKLHRNPAIAKERIVERFESFVNGTELINAYSELNDPVLQRELLVNQAREKMREKKEVQPVDEEFIEAICQGMPPTSGFGSGIDRIVMLFTDAASIRDVILFPLMKPEQE